LLCAILVFNFEQRAPEGGHCIKCFRRLAELGNSVYKSTSSRQEFIHQSHSNRVPWTSYDKDLDRAALIFQDQTESLISSRHIRREPKY